MFGIKFNFFKKKKSDVIKKVLSEEEILAIKEHFDILPRLKHVGFLSPY